MIKYIKIESHGYKGYKLTYQRVKITKYYHKHFDTFHEVIGFLSREGFDTIKW